MTEDPAREAAARVLAGSRRLAVLTGAGVSTESGIPDFRSAGGLWTRFDPAEFHLDRFLADPRRFWKLRAALSAELDLPRREPNAAHRAIARAERGGRLLGLVTQNIDGLHARAGSSPERTVEIHGSALEVNCLSCGGRFPLEVATKAVDAGDLPPRCPSCGGVLKPGTVLFGEALPPGKLERAEALAEACDVFLVVGSSLEVWPAAGLPEIARSRGAPVILLNRDETAFDAAADVVVRGSASEVLPALLESAGFLRA